MNVTTTVRRGRYADTLRVRASGQSALGRLSVGLAALTVVSASSGAIGVIAVGGSAFQIFPIQIMGPVLSLHLAVSSTLMRHRIHSEMLRRPLVLSLTLILFGIPPVLAAGSTGSAIAAYLNFATGVIAGASVGVVWASCPPSRANAIDWAVGVFVLISSVELIVSFAEVGSLAAHEYAKTAWGGSNFVAGVLVVASLALISRSREVDRGRFALRVFAVIGAAGALSTFSRGGLIALTVGVLVFTWFGPRPQRGLSFRRLIALAIPGAGIIALDYITSTRLSVNRQVEENISLRQTLWEIAWGQFGSHPAFGTGWTALESAVAPVLGTQTTFAHNAVLSFLQIGGLICGLPMLAIFGAWAWKAGRANPALAAPVAAGLCISLTDPFLEGLIGGAFFWATVVAISCRPSGLLANQEGSMSVVRPSNLHDRKHHLTRESSLKHGF